MSWAPLFSRGEVSQMVITRFEFTYIHRGTSCDFMVTVLVHDGNAYDLAVENAERVAELVREFAPDSIRAAGGHEAEILVANLERERLRVVN